MRLSLLELRPLKPFFAHLVACAPASLSTTCPPCPCRVCLQNRLSRKCTQYDSPSHGIARMQIVSIPLRQNWLGFDTLLRDDITALTSFIPFGDKVQRWQKRSVCFAKQQPGKTRLKLLATTYQYIPYLPSL